MNVTLISLIFLVISQLFIFCLIHYNRRQSIGYFTECLSRLSVFEDKFDGAFKNVDDSYIKMFASLNETLASTQSSVVKNETHRVDITNKKLAEDIKKIKKQLTIKPVE